MNRFIAYFFVFFSLFAALKLHAGEADAVRGMLERISPGLAGRLAVEIVGEADSANGADWYEISQGAAGPVVRGNSAVSVAAGVNHYLKYVAGVHLTWNNMTAALPQTLPGVAVPIRRETPLTSRYYLNYCTFSYSMAFWDWARWQREIDWMALHGINMPLAITGSNLLWRNVLRRLGYPESRIDGFIAGPAFQAWWLMNNLEGWGGPGSDADYERDADLQRRILARMREFGMEPVLPGYSGMLPHDALQTLGVDVADPGKWCGYTRPAFLLPTDKDFDRIAEIYYDELTRLYGPARYYSMDPFHEGGNAEGVDLAASAQKILAAMRRANPQSVWVIQGWQENPRREILRALPPGSLLVLDLQSENSPTGRTIGDYGHHNWLYCMLLNFGGNVGLYGKMPTLAATFAESKENAPRLCGTGLTMEGIENNPVMFELFAELPWADEPLSPDNWIAGYATARYGCEDSLAAEAWRVLAQTVYACPRDSLQQGARESLFCARPSDSPQTVSAWAASKNYYRHSDLLQAARLLAASAPRLRENRNYQYDLVDVVRQAVANRGRETIDSLSLALNRNDRCAYQQHSRYFLQLIDVQDHLLGTLPHFRLGTWLEAARATATDSLDANRREWNARVQITTWGDRTAANNGRLHDYAHREWQGLLSDFYGPRWQRWFNERLAGWTSVPGAAPDIDFYEMEQAWTLRRNHYVSNSQGHPVDIALQTLQWLSKKNKE